MHRLDARSSLDVSTIATGTLEYALFLDDGQGNRGRQTRGKRMRGLSLGIRAVLRGLRCLY